MERKEGTMGICNKQTRVRKVVFILGLAAFLWLVPASGVHAAGDAPQARLAPDERAFAIARAGLQRAVDFARSRPDLFNPDKSGKKGLMTRHDRLAVWNAWSSMLDSLAALDAIRGGWRKSSLLHGEDRCGREFSLDYACFLAGYRYALEFIVLADKNPSLDTILNEAVPELGITAGTFGRFKFRFLNVAAATEFSALKVIDKTCRDGGTKELRSAITKTAR